MAWSKTSPEERGYGKAWRRLRAMILLRDRYICQCAECKKLGRLESATHVDHIVSKAEWQKKHGSLDGVDNPSNLQAINEDCHAKKTILEKGHIVRSGCDANGWPTDPNHPWNAT